MRSTQGNEYILIGYHYNSNCIIAHPLKNQTAQVLTTTWKNLHHTFAKAEPAPKVWLVDNEILSELKTLFELNNTSFQLVPPNSHRRNLAERAIQTYKNQFKVGLATTDPKFPFSEWDRLIQQANITLNLLRTAIVNTKLSEYAYIYGQFDFRATPLTPMGTRVVAHINHSNRNTWEINGEADLYVGPAMEHYRCVTGYFPRTRKTRIYETVTFLPHEVPFPKVNLQYHLTQAAEDIITILTQPLKSTTPSLQEGDPIHNALLDIANKLK